jgi:uncharacterized protein (TIGR02118 family)
MIRYVAVLTRRPGSSTEEFLTAWLGEHQQLARALPLVRRVEFQPSVEVAGLPTSYDGVGFLEYDSVADLQASLASEQALALRAHTATFADSDAAVRAVVGPPSG